MDRTVKRCQEPKRLISAGGGNDTLLGGLDDDTLEGAGGDDYIDGGADADDGNEKGFVVAQQRDHSACGAGKRPTASSLRAMCRERLEASFMVCS
jgi:hypothetical protein